MFFYFSTEVAVHGAQGMAWWEMHASPAERIPSKSLDRQNYGWCGHIEGWNHASWLLPPLDYIAHESEEHIYGVQ